MLTQSVLLKMKKSALAAALSSGALLGSSGVFAVETPAPELVSQPKASAKVLALTAEQLKIFKENLPIYLTGDEPKRSAARTILSALGEAALPLIEAETKKASDAEKLKLGTLVRLLTKRKISGDYCPPCGRG